MRLSSFLMLIGATLVVAGFVWSVLTVSCGSPVLYNTVGDRACAMVPESSASFLQLVVVAEGALLAFAGAAMRFKQEKRDPLRLSSTPTLLALFGTVFSVLGFGWAGYWTVEVAPHAICVPPENGTCTISTSGVGPALVTGGIGIFMLLTGVAMRWSRNRKVKEGVRKAESRA